MTPAGLLALADAATPGPWSWEDVDGLLLAVKVGIGVIDNADDARLIALAPDLARLCAEMATLLAYPASADGPGDEFVRECRAALAKLSELEART